MVSKGFPFGEDGDFLDTFGPIDFLLFLNQPFSRSHDDVIVQSCADSGKLSWSSTEQGR